jgi:TolB-like protein
MRVQFGVFEVDTERGRLSKHGTTLPLRIQALEVLIALVERPGDIVTREELRHRLWSDRAFGDFEAGLNTAISRLRQALNESADSPRFIETAPKRGYRFISPVVTVPVAQQPSVAVMPFANHSSEPNNDYVSDGLTDELISALSRIKGLRVAGRSVVSRFKDRAYEVKKAGSEMGVQAILEGSVHRAMGTIRADVRLVNVEDGCELWSERFDGDWKDVFTIQDTVCERVAGALQVRQVNRLPESRPSNPDAYTAYLKGHYLTKRHTPANTKRALEYFEEAIRRDPDYALPYHGASIVHILGALMGASPPSHALAQAELFVARGLALDAGSAMVQTTLGMLRMFQWRWEEAEQAYHRAIALEPLNPHSHMMYALQCSFRRRHPEALRQARKALELDPVDPMMNFRVIQCSYYARRYDEAIESGRIAIELSPEFPYAYWYLAWSLAETAMIDESWSMANKGRLLGGGQPLVEGQFGYVAGLTGHASEAYAVLDLLKTRRGSGYCPATPIAWTHLGLGEFDACFEWLEIAFHEGEPYLATVLAFPGYDRLRGDRRFESLIRRMGVADYSAQDPK